MKFVELSRRHRSTLVEALSRFTYPLYCTTGVHDYDYHFIGSCFPLTASGRLFFILTEHQLNQAGDNDVCVGYPEAKGRFLQIPANMVRRCSRHDLAIFECEMTDEITGIHALDSSLFLQPEGEFEYAVVGCQTELNRIDHESKKIIVRKGALISAIADARVDNHSVEIDLSLCHLAAPTDHSHLLVSFDKQTQGLSGSPLLAFEVLESNEEQGKLELHIAGVATHVANNNRVLYATHHIELLACLQHLFNAFPQLMENRELDA